jgi:hypothetical protein
MDDNYNANYIPLVEKTFQLYPIQTCQNCLKNHKPQQMATTNDGNKYQKCLNCGWEWKK